MNLKAAIIGHPVTHSKSPKIHQYWMQKYNIAGEYNAVDIDPNALEAGVQKLIDQNYNGFNATIPHKESILELCNEWDESAEKIGAVNTVRIEDGQLTGYNTDAFGFIENLKRAQTAFDFKRTNVLILGAGGAARAAIYGLQEQGCTNIRICNRTRERAESLAVEFECGILDWNEKNNLQDVTLLVNTTALGMSGKDALEIDLTHLPQTAVVYDIVYAPLLTDLLLQAQDNGNQVVTGIGMLLYQAQAAFHLWTGIMPDVTTELENLVLT